MERPHHQTLGNWQTLVSLLEKLLAALQVAPTISPARPIIPVRR
jgi:hypothetical protein